jgi:hypothetical protein
MSSISIIGAGTMARILGTRALAGGNTVEVIGRDAAKVAALPGNSAAPPAGTTGSAPAGDIVTRLWVTGWARSLPTSKARPGRARAWVDAPGTIVSESGSGA